MHMPTRLARIAAALLLAASSSAFAAPDKATAALYKAAIEHPVREADRKDDAKRKPAEFLDFAQVRPGMRVLDIVAGGGATSTLLALAVGDKGEVLAQNAKPNERLAARLAAKPQANLKPVVTDFATPVPAGTAALDLVTINMNYHDIVNTPADRAAMNKALYDAIRPGGKLVIIDNAAKPGSGLADTQTLHRIDEAEVVKELSAAGFVLDASSNFLDVPADPRDQPFFKMNGKPDAKFALRFVKN